MSALSLHKEFVARFSRDFSSPRLFPAQAVILQMDLWCTGTVLKNTLSALVDDSATLSRAQLADMLASHPLVTAATRSDVICSMLLLWFEHALHVCTQQQQHYHCARVADMTWLAVSTHAGTARRSTELDLRAAFDGSIDAISKCKEALDALPACMHGTDDAQHGYSRPSLIGYMLQRCSSTCTRSGHAVIAVFEDAGTCPSWLGALRHIYCMLTHSANASRAHHVAAARRELGTTTASLLHVDAVEMLLCERSAEFDYEQAAALLESEVKTLEHNPAAAALLQRATDLSRRVVERMVAMYDDL